MELVFYYKDSFFVRIVNSIAIEKGVNLKLIPSDFNGIILEGTEGSCRIEDIIIISEYVEDVIPYPSIMPQSPNEKALLRNISEEILTKIVQPLAKSSVEEESTINKDEYNNLLHTIHKIEEIMDNLAYDYIISENIMLADILLCNAIIYYKNSYLQIFNRSSRVVQLFYRVLERHKSIVAR